jgi:two-component system, cell cycle sensor histidine kinase and response regulator CckA
MKHDDLNALAGELGMSALDEAPLTHAGPVEDEWLVERIRSALGGRVEAARVAEAVALAHEGQHRVLALEGGERALLVPGPAGRVVLYGPAPSGGPSLQRRAQVADAAASMAHEIANATGAISGWAQLGLNPATSGVSAERALELIARAADAASQAARRLLRLASGSASEPLAPVELSATVSDLVTMMGTLAREANVRLEAHLCPGVRVNASVATVFSLVWNLTKNAIEATPAHGVVEVTLHEDGDHAVLSVVDQGPGLSEEAQARIFDKYVTSKASGTGLGLPLVRAIVDELGGRLAIHSQPGRGAVFQVLLPRLPGEAPRHIDPRAMRTGPVAVAAVWPPLAVPSQPAAKAAGSTDDLRADILIVEDDDPLRELMSTFLALRGARVTCARNIHEARTVTGHFDIALIDLALDECRGDELLASLRRRGIVSAAMLVTGSVQKPRIISGGEPDDWLRKPFEIDELVARIQRVLARHVMLGELTGQSAGA